MLQKTIKNSIEFEGIGLHTGKKSHVKVLPAPENSGIKFLRAGLEGATPFLAHFSKVTSTERSIVLEDGSSRIRTPEHLLATAYGLGIDNLSIELNGEEIPAMDGSGQTFSQMFLQAGIMTQEAQKAFITISDSIWVAQDNSHVIAFPDKELKITYIADFSHPLIGTQFLEFSFNDGDFARDIAPARTFGFWEEVKSLWNRRLALGGNLENAIVIKKNCFSTPLRFEDEIVRHKCLDLIGDISLLGAQLNAHIFAIKSSHSLDIKLLNEIHKKRTEDEAGPKGPSLDYKQISNTLLVDFLQKKKQKQHGG